MEVAVLHPRDCLTDLFPRNSLTHPHRQRKPTPTNRRRRTPPRHQPSPPPSSPPVSSFIPKGSNKKNPNHNNNTTVFNHVRILKRGEEMEKKILDSAVENPDLKPTRRIVSDSVMIPSQIRVSDQNPMPALFYAGPVTSTSPPPSEVPLPAFFAKRSVSVFNPADDATNDLIRILRLDIP